MENRDYKLIFRTPQELFQPFFIELAIKGGYELLIIYRKNKKGVESYISAKTIKNFADKGYEIFRNKRKTEKLLKEEKYLAKKFDFFLDSIKFERGKYHNKVYLKNNLSQYYRLFVRYSRIYRFTELFYFHRVEKTIKTFVRDNSNDRRLNNKYFSILLNSSTDKTIKRKREKILFLLNADKKIITLCESVILIGRAKNIMRQKLDRYWGTLDEFLDKIAGSLHLTPDITKALFCKELITMLISPGKTREKIVINEAKERNKLFVAGKKNNKYFFCIGKKAKKIASAFIKKSIRGRSELTGDIANCGYVRGRAITMPAGVSVKQKKKLYKKMALMKKGNIIITANITPDTAIAYHKAGAIVADEGGITSHAAVISRELGIPCIVNTINATKMLHDGDFVEVDANKGLIKIIDKYER
jgi:phosphohistidine swiveling domain-containing protein